MECIFCKIVGRQSPADIEYEDEELMVFRDLYPKAPVHLLIVPKRHIDSVMALRDEDALLVGRLILMGRRMGETAGFADRGYRLTFNCGPEGGQVVYHLHLHFLAGRR